MSTSEQYERLHKAYTAIDQSELSQCDAGLQKNVLETLSGWRELYHHCQSSGVFSNNEELDDVHTNDIKYLTIPYFMADLLIKIVDTRHLEHLKEAKIQLENFIEKCKALAIISREEFKLLSEVRPGDRTARIDRLRKEKEVVARLGDLNQRKRRLTKIKPFTDDDDENGANGDGMGGSLVDDLEREYQRLSTEQCLRRAVDKLSMCNKEIELLSLSQRDKQTAVEDYAIKQQELKEKPHNPPIVIQPSQLTQRDQILSTMFKPFNQPNMSMDEYMTLHPNEFAAPPPPPPHSSQLKKGGGRQEDDEEEENEKDEAEDDEALHKQRAWDDWKDDHPKGYGNRKGNIG